MSAATGPTAFPWAAAMAFGFGRLRLSPRAFWSMTPRELIAAHAPFAMQSGTPPDRGTLSGLMAAFPDE